MHLALPILLLTATAALAQSQPALPDKPFIYDGPAMNLRSFSAPKPVTVGPPGESVTVQPMTVVPAPAPKAEAPYIDDRQTEKLCTFDNPPPCQKPLAPKPLAKSVV